MNLRALARLLITRLLHVSRSEALLGDLEEEYLATSLPRLGRRRADLSYFREALVAIAHFAQQQIRRTIMTIGSHIVRNVLAATIFWLTAFALIQAAQRFLGDWRASELMQLAACAVGVLVSLRLRANLVALLLAGQVAFTFSELVMHSFYGIRKVQGAPTHFAVMGAATLGVLLGMLIVPHLSKKTPLKARVAAT